MLSALYRQGRTRIMARLSDEILMSYADGVLSEQERASVEATLATDTQERERLAVFQNTGRTLGQLFDQPLQEDVPERLIRAVLSAQQSRKAGKTSLKDSIYRGLSLDPVIAYVRDMTAPRKWAPVMGAVCAAALIIVSYNFQLDSSSPGPQMSVLMNQPLSKLTPLSRFLDMAPMKKSFDWREQNGAAKQGEIVFTFVNKQGELCRQYELTNASSKTFSGIACRLETGNWSVWNYKPNVSVKVGVTVPVDTRNYYPADGEHNPTIDALVDRMISGDVLGAEDEAALITHNWRVKNNNEGE